MDNLTSVMKHQDATVTIFTGEDCRYCTKAKALLDALEVEYIEQDVEDSPMYFKTVPQIFVASPDIAEGAFGLGKHVGGFSDIKALLIKALFDTTS